VSYAPGCGGDEGNQSCKIARCSLQHEKPEYCSQCQEFSCEKYENIDAFDSFVTHQNRKKDLEKQQEIGVEVYRAEQEEKIRILKWLLQNYVTEQFQKAADKQGIVLKLRKKK